jgi:hypothetical protein
VRPCVITGAAATTSTWPSWWLAAPALGKAVVAIVVVALAVAFAAVLLWVSYASAVALVAPERRPGAVSGVAARGGARSRRGLHERLRLPRGPERLLSDNLSVLSGLHG